jgi:hypothetical protein
VILAALLLVQIAFSLPMDGALSGDDHYSLWVAHALWAGDVLNRDVFDPGSPLQSILSYVGQLATGHRPIGEAVTAIVFRVLGIVCVYLLARQASGHRGIAAGVAVIVGVLLLPSGVYAVDRLVLYPGAVLLAWRFLANPSTTSTVPLGAVAGVAFLLRHDHGLYVGIPLLATVLLARRSPWMFVLTAAAVVAPWLIWIESTEGVVSYFTTRLGFAQSLGLTRSRPGFWLGPGNPLARENALRLLWMTAVVTTACGLAMALWRKDRRVAVLALMTMLAELGIMREIGRYPELAALWLSLAAWMAAGAGSLTSRVAWGLAASVIAAAAVSATNAVREIPQIAFEGGGLFSRVYRGLRLQSTYPPIDVYAPPGITDDRLIVRYVHDCLDPDDRVWETSDWFSLPYQSERRLVEHPYWSLGFLRERDAQFAARLPRSGMPPLIVVRGVKDPLEAFEHYPATQALVAREYTPITSARFEHFRAEVVDVRLLGHRDRAATGVFEPLDLPCFRSAADTRRPAPLG